MNIYANTNMLLNKCVCVRAPTSKSLYTYDSNPCSNLTGSNLARLVTPQLAIHIS